MSTIAICALPPGVHECPQCLESFALERPALVTEAEGASAVCPVCMAEEAALKEAESR